MSNVVTIKRTGPRPLSRTEIEQALGSRQDFTRCEDGGWRLIATPSEPALFLNVEENEAWTDGGAAWLEDPAIGELRQLAAMLDAQMLDETGGQLTFASDSAAEAPGAASKASIALGAILTLALAPLLILFALLRLPWVLWRVARPK